MTNGFNSYIVIKRLRVYRRTLDLSSFYGYCSIVVVVCVVVIIVVVVLGDGVARNGNETFPPLSLKPKQRISIPLPPWKIEIPR